MSDKLNGYELSRAWFDWSFENPEKVSPNHSAIYFFAIEHCNRLGWKSKFGFPTQMVMDAIGIHKHQTYIKYFNDLCEWGFFKLIQKSQNQYSANIICLQSAMPKKGKALDKAIINHAAKQTQTIGQSNSSIYKPINHITINKPLNQIYPNSELGKSMLTQFDRIEMIQRNCDVSEAIVKKWIPKFIQHAMDNNQTYPTNAKLWNHFGAWFKGDYATSLKLDKAKSNGSPVTAKLPPPPVKHY